MGDSEEQELHITGCLFLTCLVISLHTALCSVSDTIQKTSSQSEAIPNSSSDTFLQQSLYWWIHIATCIIFILVGQSIAILLGRLYYDKGGKSKWMATLIQFVGFPVLLPLYNTFSKEISQENKPKVVLSIFRVASIYIVLGLLGAGASMLYSVGLKYLPVSTFSLICASQLSFNALFSFSINSQKLTPYIINSLVLLTISSALLVFQPNPSRPEGVSKEKYFIGVLCAFGNAAGFGLSLTVTEFALQRILKNVSFKATLDMMIFMPLVASCLVTVGLLASGEWNTLKAEMDQFELGKLSYMITLIGIAVSWQVFSIGSLGLIAKVSSLFSDVVATLGLPIVPILAVIFFHDTMDGIKVVAILLAIWGFVSYTYQEYLDLYKAVTRKPVTTNTSRPCENDN